MLRLRVRNRAPVREVVGKVAIDLPTRRRTAAARTHPQRVPATRSRSQGHGLWPHRTAWRTGAMRSCWRSARLRATPLVGALRVGTWSAVTITHRRGTRGRAGPARRGRRPNRAI